MIKDFQYFQIWGVTTFMTRESDNFILNNPTSEKLDQIKDIVNNKILSFEERIFRINTILET